MSLFDRRRRAIAGADYRFPWISTDGYPAEDPTLTVRWPASGAGSTEYVLEAVRAPDIITSISDDGLEITITTGPEQPGSTMRGVVQGGGHVWIDGGADYQGPARLVALVSQTSLAATTTGTAVLRLAEPLSEQTIVSQRQQATGSIVLSAGFAAAAATGAFVLVAGVAFELDEFGGTLSGGFSGHTVDLESSPGVRCSDATLAQRIANCINAANIGVTATAASLTVTLTAGHDVTAEEQVEESHPSAGLVAVTSLTGAATAWTLRYLAHSVVIPAEDVGDAVLRGVVWTLPWSRKAGADLPALGCVERGILDVVLVPWDTGLTDEHLYALVPGWRAIVPQAQSSWQAQREAALGELEDLIRPRLAEGRHVDQLLGEQFRLAHAYLTAARVLQWLETVGVAPAFALERYQEQAQKAADGCMSRLVWIDLDDDGEISTAEQDVQAAGIGPRRLPARRTVDQRDSSERPARGRWWDPR